MRHIYIHVPFCGRRCVYCDFAIAVRPDTPSDRFVDSIATELRLRRDHPGWDDSPIETVYLGGGTPSRLDPAAVAILLDRIRIDAGLSPKVNVEITLEANPEDVSKASAEAWVAAGVNRVSLGAQSFHPRVLEWMHRMHTADQTVQAVDILRNAGITTLSLDLIFGLPQALGHDVARDVERAVALAPDHLSAYGLTIEARTPLFRRRNRGETVAAPDEQYQSDFLAANRDLVEAGFEHYEVSNYALPGKRAVHNSAYWSGRPYLGLGPSAHSFDGGRRRWNEREWTQYLALVEAGRDPVGGSETLTEEQRVLEAIMLGLRTSTGVELKLIDADRVEELSTTGWLAVEGERLRLTTAGWLRMEAILARLTTSAKGG